MTDCIFCKIIAKEIGSYKVYEDEYTYAFLDIAGDYYGHTLVVPKKHSTNILDCDNVTLAHVFNAVKLISQHYTNNCGFSAVNVVVNNGRDSGQMVDHLHVHIIPRRKDDGLDVLAQQQTNNDMPFEEIAQQLQLV